MADDMKEEPVDGGEATERDRYVATPILNLFVEAKLSPILHTKDSPVFSVFFKTFLYL